MTIHKKIATSIVSLACGLVMWQAMKNSCPPREKHLQAVTDVVEETVNRIFEEKISFPEESKELAQYLSTDMIPKIVAKITEQRIDFKDFALFSIGMIEGEEYMPVSIGVLGRVFTFDSEDGYEYANKIIGETELNNIINYFNNINYGINQTESNEGE